MMETVKKKITLGKVVSKILLYVMFGLLGVVLIFPYVFMILRGLMDFKTFSAPIMKIFPTKWMFSNYINAFSKGGYGLPLVNSIWLCLLNTFIVPTSSLIAAYAFSRLEWIGKKFVFAVMMGTTMVPGIVTHIPLYVLYNNLGMADTYYPLFVPSILFSGAMNVFLVRQFMVSHPKEIYESATIDGAGPFKSFVHIALPLSKTIFIYIAIGTFMGGWGDYYTPSIFLKNVEANKRTFALALYKNLGADQTNITHPEYVFSACTILSIVPTVLFAFFQKYLVQGIATAGLKG